MCKPRLSRSFDTGSSPQRELDPCGTASLQRKLAKNPAPSRTRSPGLDMKRTRTYAAERSMLRALGTKARAIAAVLLVSLAASGASQLLPAHAAEGHDLACVPGLALPHDESAHRLAADTPSESEHPLHCLVCHWARSFRPAGAALRQPAPVLASRVFLHVDIVIAPTAAVSARISPRSPPASSTFLSRSRHSEGRPSPGGSSFPRGLRGFHAAARARPRVGAPCGARDHVCLRGRRPGSYHRSGHGRAFTARRIGIEVRRFALVPSTIRVLFRGVAHALPYALSNVLRVVCHVLLSASLAAQAGVTFSGRLLNSLSGDPIGGATVQIDELRRQTVSAARRHVHVRERSPRRVSPVGALVRLSRRAVRKSPSAPHRPRRSTSRSIRNCTSKKSSRSARSARSQFEAFQPTSVLAGQELTKQLEMSIGDTLQNQPGVAARSFGPAPSRPVIRGLSGDRVLILQDGQRMSDLSSQSGDHGVTVNPAGAQRIEVVRGPATLLYGANAIGGLVNIITEDIPTRPVSGASGNFTFDLGSAAKEGGAAGRRAGRQRHVCAARGRRRPAFR